METQTLYTGFPKSKVFFDFSEYSLGEYVLTKFSANKKVSYILSLQNDCGVSTLIDQGEVEGGRVSSDDIPPTKVFTNLKDGVYILTVSVEGLPAEAVKLYNFPSLECSILESIEDLFSNCGKCKSEIDLCCLLAKMNYFNILCDITILPNLVSKFRCTMTERIGCKIREERNSNECNDNLHLLLAINYLSMYQVRNFENKKSTYNYEKIYNYITSNIITLR